MKRKEGVTQRAFYHHLPGLSKRGTPWAGAAWLLTRLFRWELRHIEGTTEATRAGTREEPGTILMDTELLSGMTSSRNGQQ